MKMEHFWSGKDTLSIALTPVQINYNLHSKLLSDDLRYTFPSSSGAILRTIITAAILTATVPLACAKKSERQAGYRNGAVDGQKAADAFDAGRLLQRIQERIF
jgi:hypothetical protein